MICSNCSVSTISFAITLMSLLIGYFAFPSSLLTKTVQMFFSNVVFDGVTVLTTLSILRASVRKQISIPNAILLDVIVAALLACGSLFFGLIFTPNALAPGEVLSVLIGRAPDNTQYELGPCFWPSTQPSSQRFFT
jgi:hypothetical protein